MDKKYDVIIVGAGIGGLICANYLARAGKEVLILEKNNFPGGCCSSFTVNNFFFNTGGHLINDLGFGGSFRQILTELGIFNKNDFVRLDPFAVVFTGKNRYVISGKYNELWCYLKKKFPKDNVDGFFSLLNKGQLYWYYKFKDFVFQHILDQYFVSEEIKIIFLSLVYSCGMLPEKISAVCVLKILKLSLLSGGFYPRDGMQSLSKKLMNSIIKNKGRVILNREIKEVLIRGQKVYGVLGSNGEIFYSDIIVSNISPVNTWSKLKKNTRLIDGVREKVKKMELSESAFIVHLALKSNLKVFSRKTLYIFADFVNFEKNNRLYLGKKQSYRPFGFSYMPNNIFQTDIHLRKNTSANLMTLMYYKPARFWNGYKDKIAEYMIQRIGNVVSGFKANILFTRITTPDMIELYTGNNRGATGGWAITPQQIGRKRILYSGKISNLLFAGHWTHLGMGINSVAVSGRNAAKEALKILDK